MDDIDEFQSLMERHEACDDRAETNLCRAVGDRVGQYEQMASNNNFDEEDAGLKEEIDGIFGPIKVAIDAGEPVARRAFSNAARLIDLREEHLDNVSFLNAKQDEEVDFADEDDEEDGS